MIPALVACGVVSLVLLGYLLLGQPRITEKRYESAFRAFNAAIELRFPSERGIGEEAAVLVQRVSKALKLRAKDRKRLVRSAWLRDIGLCSVPYQQINHRRPELWTESEWSLFRQHPSVGAEMLETIPALAELAPIISESQCAGGRVESQVLAVVSDFLWHERRSGTAAARQHLERDVEERYDSKVVAALNKCLEDRG